MFLYSPGIQTYHEPITPVLDELIPTTSGHEFATLPSILTQLTIPHVQTTPAPLTFQTSQTPTDTKHFREVATQACIPTPTPQPSTHTSARHSTTHKPSPQPTTRTPTRTRKIITKRKTYHLNLHSGSFIIMRNNKEIGYLTADNNFFKF